MPNLNTGPEHPVLPQVCLIADDLQDDGELAIQLRDLRDQELEDGRAYHPDRLTDIFEWEAFRAGLPPIRLHDLRHSAASIAHAAGASMKEIQALLRHSSLTITADLYTSVFEDQAAQLAEDMARAVPRRRDAVAGDSAPTDGHTTATLAAIDPREGTSQP